MRRHDSAFPRFTTYTPMPHVGNAPPAINSDLSRVFQRTMGSPWLTGGGSAYNRHFSAVQRELAGPISGANRLASQMAVTPIQDAISRQGAARRQSGAPTGPEMDWGIDSNPLSISAQDRVQQRAHGFPTHGNSAAGEVAAATRESTSAAAASVLGAGASPVPGAPQAPRLVVPSVITPRKRR